MNKTMNNNKIIFVQDLKKQFRTGMETLLVLDGIRFEVRLPKIVSITGESGSGKSTLLNILGGLDYATSGSITVGGYQVDTLSEDELTEFRKHTVGFIFQFHFLLKDFSALENVLLPGYMAGLSKEEAECKAEMLLGRVSLKNRLSHYPSQLSGGERQRVAVARAMMNEPEIILADEPTGNLDEDNSRNVEEILFSMAHEAEKTLVLVTHDKELASRADQAYNLSRGVLETA